MSLLYYWRGDNYRRDLDWGAGYNLNQANPSLHEVEIGESLWAFTRARNGDYVLACELIVAAKTLNHPDFRYGRYRVWGDLQRSRYFRVEGQPSAEMLIRSLSCKADAQFLGRAFQGYAAVRKISNDDHLRLLAHSRQLFIEPRARILPEEQLEAAFALGDGELLRSLVADESAGISEQRRAYLTTKAVTRNRQLAKELRLIYKGVCQVTGWNPREMYGMDLCEAHHLHRLSRGGEDALDNMILICQNVHTAIHGLDAPFDHSDGALVFGDMRQKLIFNCHLALSNDSPL